MHHLAGRCALKDAPGVGVCLAFHEPGHDYGIVGHEGHQSRPCSINSRILTARMFNRSHSARMRFAARAGELLRGVSGATNRATGLPRLVITTSPPALTSSTSWDSFALAS